MRAWGEGCTSSDIDEWLAKGQTLVTDVPKWMQDHLLSRMNEAYRDGIETSLGKGRPIDEIRGQLFAECFTGCRYEAPAYKL